MSPWPGKFVIGLTGNIGAGKSVVRRMLEHLGAFGIDADALAHRAISPGAPGYVQVIATFGHWLLDEDGAISRARLGRIVFSDPAALAQLESIIHPLVRQAIDVLAQRVRQKVIVIEAIKLLEGGLFHVCDSIWVTHAAPEIRLQRLVEKRGMHPDAARARMSAQSRPEDKLAAADIIIRNERRFENTWSQVSTAWIKLFPAEDTEPIPLDVAPGEFAVQRARPSQAGQIAAFINRVERASQAMTPGDVMEAFGEKAFLLLLRGGQTVGLLGWRVENLITRSGDLYLEPGIPLGEAAQLLVEQMEAASSDLQSEASLLFLPRDLATRGDIWEGLGYEKRSIEALEVRAWQEAARESNVLGADLYFKRLRADRIMHPI